MLHITEYVYGPFSGNELGRRLYVNPLTANGAYSCFEKRCPIKPYATMPKGIMGNGGSWSLIEA